MKLFLFALLSSTACATKIAVKQEFSNEALDRPHDEAVRVPGNGYCWDAQKRESTSRRFTSADCEAARFVCARDCHCVAWACQMGQKGSVLYTSSHCSANCGNVNWLVNPDLILQAGHDKLNNQFNNGECWKWVHVNKTEQVQADLEEFNKCLVPAITGASINASQCPRDANGKITHDSICRYVEVNGWDCVDTTTQCHNQNMSWTPICTPKKCPVPQISGATVSTNCQDGSEVQNGTECIWTVLNNHTCENIGTLTCLYGNFTATPTCIPKCYLPVVSGAEVQCQLTDVTQTNLIPHGDNCTWTPLISHTCEDTQITCADAAWNETPSCQQNVCTCSNGNPAEGTACTSPNAAKCASCLAGFHPNDDNSACQPNVCTCSNGNPAEGTAACVQHDGAACASCNSGFKLAGIVCVSSWTQISSGTSQPRGGITGGTVSPKTFPRVTFSEIKLQVHLDHPEKDWTAISQIVLRVPGSGWTYIKDLGAVYIQPSGCANLKTLESLEQNPPGCAAGYDGSDILTCAVDNCGGTWHSPQGHTLPAGLSAEQLELAQNPYLVILFSQPVLFDGLMVEPGTGGMEGTFTTWELFGKEPEPATYKEGICSDKLQETNECCLPTYETITSEADCKAAYDALLPSTPDLASWLAQTPTARSKRAPGCLYTVGWPGTWYNAFQSDPTMNGRCCTGDMVICKKVS